MTLSQWLDKWLEEYIKGTVRESTLEGYRRDIMNHVIPYLGEKQLRKITGQICVPSIKNFWSEDE